MTKETILTFDSQRELEAYEADHCPETIVPGGARELCRDDGTGLIESFTNEQCSKCYRANGITLKVKES